MVQYQLEVAIALGVAVIGSASFFYLNRPKEGKIHLPVYGDDDDRPTHDPFDVTMPQDLSDGEPIEEEKFWARVRLIIALVQVPLGSS